MTACCSALLDWLPRSSGNEAQLASDGIQFPVASEIGATSKSKSNGDTPALEDLVVARGFVCVSLRMRGLATKSRD